jgi:hypothetical protein
MNVSASARRSPESIRAELLPPLRQAAAEVESDLRRAP